MISKTIINPEWEGCEEQVEEAYSLSQAGGLADFYALCPGECGAKIPEKGAWIMVKISPHTEFTVPVLSMWYAIEDIRPHSTTNGQNWHLAKILTPKGDLYLWPNEYTVVKDISPYLEFPDDHIHIHLLGGMPMNKEALFYIRSRGISKAEAIKMLLGDVKTQNVAFVTVHPVYQQAFTRGALPPTERLATTDNWKS